jgi:hypothetical protein
MTLSVSKNAYFTVLASILPTVDLPEPIMPTR